MEVDTQWLIATPPHLLPPPPEFMTIPGAEARIDSPVPAVPSSPLPIDPPDMKSIDDPKDDLEVEQTTLIKDATYYLDTVTFDVEDRLFLVPKYHFVKQTDFFTSPFCPVDINQNHILVVKLDGVEKTDFRALLKLLYPLSLEDVPLSKEEWVSVLKLSTKWTMIDIRDMAIQHLTSSTIPFPDMVVLARTYGVIEWLRTAYLKLAERTEGISIEEAITLGLETTLNLCSVRERVLQNHRHVYESRYPPAASEVGDHGSMVDKEFEHELREVQTESWDSIDRVLLARTHGMAKWLRSAYLELVERTESITVDEAERLGLEATIGVCRLRAQVLQSFYEKTRSYGMNCSVNYPNAIEEKFATEIWQVKVMGNRYRRVPLTAVPRTVRTAPGILGAGKKKKMKK